jgi:hypothetical protein
VLLTDDAECVVRCTPGEDATNGFFVSCFMRQPQGELTKLGKRGRASVKDENGEGGTEERGEGIIHMGKRANQRGGNRSRKKKRGSTSV